MINELFGIVCLTNSCTFFLFFFFLSTFRILFTGIRDGSLSLFLLRFKLSFKPTPFLKLLEHCQLFSQHAVQILTSIALQFLYAVTKAWQGFRVALRTLKIVAFLAEQGGAVVAQLASAQLSEREVPGSILGDCFDFPLIRVAIALNTRKTEH